MQRTLKEEAQIHESKQIKNISELNVVATDAVVNEQLDVEYPYKYIEIDGDKYRIPNSVIGSLKAVLEDNPELKTFKVRKTGEGMTTKYTLIPLS